MSSGIPSLLGAIASVTNTAALLVADAEIIANMFAGPKWGVFNQDGSQALAPDSIISFEFKRDWSVPDYPQEAGAFQTYNKVTTPNETKIQMTKGGTAAEREAFLVAVSSLGNSLTLVNVAMPEGTLIHSMTITHFDFRRTSTSGVGLLTVDVWLKQVRVTATAAFTNTTAASGAATTSNGTVQSQPATTAQTSALAGVT